MASIQAQIWDSIVEADLIICDLTGHNPNVMFEAGVCAAVKDVEQVVFLRDTRFPIEPPFDVAPFRYLKDQLTSDRTQRPARFFAKFCDRSPD